MAPALLVRRLVPLLALIAATAAHAGVVTTAADDGSPGSLRSQVAAGGVVTFAAAVQGQAFVLVQGPIQVPDGTQIEGPGAQQPGVVGSGARLFAIPPGASATIRNLRLSNGNAGAGQRGGAILNEGTLLIEDAALTGNSAGDAGGALYNRGTVLARRSLFAGNQVLDATCAGGGAIRSEGPGSSLRLEDSTVSGNDALPCNGGGISFNRGTATLVASTVVGNQANLGGGNLYKGSAAASLTLHASVIADGVASGGEPVNRDLHGAQAGLASLGHNLVRQRGDATGWLASDLPEGSDPLLAALGDNGGGTSSHLPQPGSPLREALPAPCPTATDQRGNSRPQGAACDIGAVEYRLNRLTATVTGGGAVSAAATPPPVAGAIAACTGTCSADYDGEATPAPVVTLTAVANVGQQFEGWGGDCSGSAASTLVTLDQARACSATFGPEPILVEVVVGDNGSLTPGSAQLVPPGTVLVFTATPDPGYRIDQVGGCGGTLAGNQFTTAPISAPCTVTASFAANTFHVGGQVVGLSGSGLVLRLNGGNDLAIAGNGPFQFPQPLNDLSPYAVTVAATPGAPPQDCTVANGTGVLNGADVDDVQVSCLAPAALQLTLDNGRDHLRYGALADWTVTLTNTGASDATGLGLGGLLPPAQVDLAATTWTCTGAGNGATCTGAGTGNLADGNISLPAGRSLTWLLTAPVRFDAPGARLAWTASAAGPGLPVVLASDDDLLVLLRDGFQGGDGAQAPGCALAVDLGAGHLFEAGVTAADRRIGTVLDAGAFAVESIAVDTAMHVRLAGLAADGGGQASAWLQVAPGATLHLAATAIGPATTRVELDDGASRLALDLPVALPARVPARQACPD